MSAQVPEMNRVLYLGDVVPADCELIESDYLSIDQGGAHRRIVARSGAFTSLAGGIMRPRRTLTAAVVLAVGALPGWSGLPP
jgi:hypothetical protein